MNKKGTPFFIAGAVLILVAIGFTVYNYCESLSAEKKASQAVMSLESHISQAVVQQDKYTQYEEASYYPDYVLDPEMDMPTVSLEGYSYIGVLEIPALSLKLPVLESWSDALLRVAPCRYEGSAYKDGFIIAAHNYSSHFADLKELDLGHEIIFTDVEGNCFNYIVASVESLEATDVEEMSSGGWDLTLFTCTPGGQYRVTVRCIRSE